MKVTDNIDIINIDNDKLEELRKTNSLDIGAYQILEGLDLFLSDVLDKYAELKETKNKDIPYKEIVISIYSLINSAVEKPDVREAMMTGLLTHSDSFRKKKLSFIKNCAKSMQLSELAAIFNVSKQTMFTYCKTHNIEYKKGVFNGEEHLCS